MTAVHRLLEDLFYKHLGFQNIRSQFYTSAPKPVGENIKFSELWADRACILSTPTNLDCLPTPLSVFGIFGQSPHVEVRLDRLRTQDVIFLVLASRSSLVRRREAEAFGS